MDTDEAVTVLISEKTVPREVLDSNSNGENSEKAAGAKMLDTGGNSGHFQKA